MPMRLALSKQQCDGPRSKSMLRDGHLHSFNPVVKSGGNLVTIKMEAQWIRSHVESS